jgi:DUF4097 and DUF4098 domain-containing protein YvlB
VETNDAGVEVHSVDGNQVAARVVTRDVKISDHDVRITERQDGDQIRIELHRPTHHFCIGICNQSVRVELTVPRATDLNVHTGDGAIDVDHIRGAARLETGDGHIEARSFDGTLDVDTHDGHVRTDGRYDHLDVHTGDGSVEVEVANGSAMTGPWSIRTGDGRITLRLPADFSAELDAHSGDGHIEADIPVTVSGNLRGNSLRGRMNNGGQLLEIRSGDGNIRIDKL